MSMSRLVKGKLINNETHAELEFKFNPSEYSIKKSNNTHPEPSPGKNAPAPQFQGGDPLTMTFQLFFDTYEGEEMMMDDVRDKYTNKLLDLTSIEKKTLRTDPNAKKGRPPLVTFIWGDYWSFKGVLKDVGLKFTLFTSQGKPVRATADITLLQAEEEGANAPQNPTSGGEGVRSSRVVQAGDTLDLIAYQEYGDATKWRPLAVANGLEDPRGLRPGQRLVVPELI